MVDELKEIDRKIRSLYDGVSACRKRIQTGREKFEILVQEEERQMLKNANAISELEDKKRKIEMKRRGKS